MVNLLEENKELRQTVSNLQDVIGELREKLGKLTNQVENLEKENEDLKAELDRRPSPNVLPAKIDQGRREVLQKVGFWSSTLKDWIEKRLPEQEHTSS